MSGGQIYLLLASDVAVSSGPVVQERRGALLSLPGLATVARPDGFMARWKELPRTPLSPGAFEPIAQDSGVATAAWEASGKGVEATRDSFSFSHQGVFPEQRRTQRRSPIDTMLILSLGSDRSTKIALDGGIAGALWAMVARSRVDWRAENDETENYVYAITLQN